MSEANRGLIAFRQGDTAKGDELYRAAILGFRQLHEARMARSAMAYRAREAIRAKHPRAREILAEAKDGLLPDTHKIAALVVKQAELLVAQVLEASEDAVSMRRSTVRE